VVFFFSLSGCKLPTYILPAWPFLALALGHFFTHSAWQSGLAFGRVAAAGLMMQVVLHLAVVPWYAQYRSPLGQWTELARHCADRETPVICYPRMCNSIAFYLQREDITWFRSKEIENLRQTLRRQPTTVLLLSHRHSLQVLEQTLPPEFEVRQVAHFGLPPVPGLPGSLGRSLAKSMGETALDLADLVVIRPRGLNGFEEAAAEAMHCTQSKVEK
jgi:hypothetical protein